MGDFSKIANRLATTLFTNLGGDAIKIAKFLTTDQTFKKSLHCVSTFFIIRNVMQEYA